MDNIHIQSKIATIEALRPKKKLPRWIPIGAGLLMSGFLMTAVFFALQSELFTRASDSEPRDLVITQVSPTATRIVWNTGQDVQGTLIYGTNPNALNFFSPEIFPTRDHSITLTGLTPNTTYYFGVKVGDAEPYLDLNKVPWSFTTMTDGQTKQTVEQLQDKVFQIEKSPTQTRENQPINQIKTSCPLSDCCAIKANLGLNGCDTEALVQNNCMNKIAQCQ